MRWLLCCTCLLALPVFAADDLLSIYQDTLRQSPNLLEARAGSDVRRQEEKMARSHLLPNLSLSGALSTNQANRSTPGTSVEEFAYDSQSYTLSLKQPLYRPDAWAGLNQAQAQVTVAEADVGRATQELSIKVASAYFDALFSEDQMRLVQSQLIAMQAQLKAAKLGLTAGSGTLTDIDDAQAKLDMAEVKKLEIKDRIEDTRLVLETLAGRTVGELLPLDLAHMNLVVPAPDHVEGWVSLGEQNNQELIGLRWQVSAIDQDVKKSLAGHLPTVDLVASLGTSSNDNLSQLTQNGSTVYRTQSIGVQLSMPLYSGGYVSADVERNRARREQIRQKMEDARRTIVTQIRRAHRDATSGIAKIYALDRAEKSAARRIVSSQKGVEAGTRTTLDVLQAQQQMFTVRRDLAEASYAFVLARLRLQSLIGNVDIDVISKVNLWFG
ncbi:TolC family outer membrane protein [Neptunomonas antarctica]|uniref:Outer membrane protein/outer membrane protein, protease secretion system n=1 Tax=Neptunomonas antarctica TaxID=619304 RepID=A0A1N7N3Z0_9GAMM|nr:TolC family outer membrane protein [Neptunomonas antarctica]SIS93076.1 outer membrane protein/outer membrane protein, protease secretion system [Neptunomonas antarctica]